MSNKITKEHIGKRVLAREAVSVYPKTPTELYVMEISPSLRFIKIKYLSGAIEWIGNAEYEIIEVLYGLTTSDHARFAEMLAAPITAKFGPGVKAEFGTGHIAKFTALKEKLKGMPTELKD